MTSLTALTSLFRCCFYRRISDPEMTVATRSTADVVDCFHVAVVGGAIMDMVYKVERMPDDDESLDAQGLETKPGGKGSNSAIAIFRAQHEKPTAKGSTPRPIGEHLPESSGIGMHVGAVAPRRRVKVYLNTAVGKDKFGEMLKENLRENRIETSTVREFSRHQSGTCSVFVMSRSGKTRDIGFPGANTHWTPRDADCVDTLAYGTRPNLIVCHLETERSTIEKILKTAAQHNVDTLFNPSPVRHIVKTVYEGLTHLVVNRGEVAEMTGRETSDLETPESWEEAAKFFLDMGVKNVVITLGEKGAFYANNDGPPGFVKAVKVEQPVDMTGAGDTFVGYYAMEYVRQRHRNPYDVWDIRRAVELGCRAAAKTISGWGAQDAVPWADEIDD